MMTRVIPAPGQESVWDYPRPSKLEAVNARVRVMFAGVTIADSDAALRVLETSHPPTYYIPLADIVGDAVRLSARSASVCEWKGVADYYDVVIGDRRMIRAAWRYPDPTPPFRAISETMAFYPARVDACYVGDERVRAQPGGFYGGWITDAIVGPFKGDIGTAFW